MEDLGEIHIERRLGAEIGEVWKALTQPELVAQWWAAGDVQPVVGHRFTLDMGDFGQQQCIVIAVEAPTMFSYVFGADTIDTAIRWTLSEDELGSILTVDHEGFDLDTPDGIRAYQGMEAGWPQVLDRLEALVTA